MNLKNTLFIAIACMVATQAQAQYHWNPNGFKYVPRPMIFTNQTNQAAALGLTGSATFGALYKARSLMRKNPLGALGSLYLASLGARSTVAVEQHSQKPMIFTNERFPGRATEGWANVSFGKNSKDHGIAQPTYLAQNPHAALEGMSYDRYMIPNPHFQRDAFTAVNNGLEQVTRPYKAFKTYLMSPVTPEQEAAYKRAMFFRS